MDRDERRRVVLDCPGGPLDCFCGRAGARIYPRICRATEPPGAEFDVHCRDTNGKQRSSQEKPVRGECLHDVDAVHSGQGAFSRDS